MNKTQVLLACAAIVAGSMAQAATAPNPKQVAAMAVADPTRPAEDKARDADRKPADMLVFAGVKPGMTVVDMLPGAGYFTRLFSSAVGPTGKVIAFIPDEMMGNSTRALDRIKPVADSHSNVMVVHNPLTSPGAENTVDVVWTSQNYHDVHNVAGVDLVAANRAVLRSLKPGGVYIVLDHVAPVGSGLANTKDLHRIDPATVKAEALAAGFVFDGESKVLANASDPHNVGVFDASLRGHTDQFAYRFRKPGGRR